MITVSFRQSVQIGPEDWDIVTHIKEVSPETTISEIDEWYKQLTKTARSTKCGNIYTLYPMKSITLHEQITPE